MTVVFDTRWESAVMATVWEERIDTYKRLLSSCKNIIDYHLSFLPEKREDVLKVLLEVFAETGVEILMQDESLSRKDLLGVGSAKTPLGPVVIEYTVRNSSCTVMCMGNDRPSALAIAETFKSKFEPLVKVEDPTKVSVEITFAGEDIMSTNTVITCPEWSEIRSNYVPSTQAPIDSLIKGIDLSYGKLLIFHGAPGTGKTYAIRSFLRSVKDTYTVINVTDPNTFLTRSDYYYQVIGWHGGSPVLFILEDSAEGLLRETRRSNEASISKILNLTDGLVSDGRKDLFLVTFNEKLEELDPAITRPGRCNSIVKFNEFTKDEAKAWLEANKLPDFSQFLASNKTSWTLAELYALLHGAGVVTHSGKLVEGNKLGFQKRRDWDDDDEFEDFSHSPLRPQRY